MVQLHGCFSREYPVPHQCPTATHSPESLVRCRADDFVHRPHSYKSQRHGAKGLEAVPHVEVSSQARPSASRPHSGLRFRYATLVPWATAAPAAAWTPVAGLVSAGRWPDAGSSTRSARALASLPPAQMWKDLPALVRDGVVYSVDTIKSKGRAQYDPVL
jgi:hypothetical protein